MRYEGNRIVSSTYRTRRRHEPTLDAHILGALIDELGDEAFVRDTVRLYLAELGTRLDTMRAAACEDGTDSLAGAAHSLKSASALLGITRLTTLCLAVELAARRDVVDWADLDDAIAEAARARTALERFLTDGEAAAPAPRVTMEA